MPWNAFGGSTVKLEKARSKSGGEVQSVAQPIQCAAEGRQPSGRTNTAGPSGLPFEVRQGASKSTGPACQSSIVLNCGLTINSGSVTACTSLTVIPGATSFKSSPVAVTSIKARSVMTELTTPLPVKG